MRQSNDRLPAAALALSTKKVWEVIRSQKDLNLPAHKVRDKALRNTALHSPGVHENGQSQRFCCSWTVAAVLRLSLPTSSRRGVQLPTHVLANYTGQRIRKHP